MEIEITHTNIEKIDIFGPTNSSPRSKKIITLRVSFRLVHFPARPLPHHSAWGASLFDTAP